MELKDLQELVNHRLVTDITLYNHYEENPSELEKISMEDAAKMGMMSQPATVVAVVEGGVDVLPTYDSEPVEPMTFEKLVELINSAVDGSVITLTSDVEFVGRGITINNKNLTLDLAGYKIVNNTATEGENPYCLGFKVENSTLTITGNGVIETISDKSVYTMPLWIAKNSTVTIENGTFVGDGADNNGSAPLYVQEGTLNINGGTFKNLEEVTDMADTYIIVNCQDTNFKKGTAKVNITGGSFYKWNPADNNAEGANTSFVADGYTAVADGDWFVVTEAPKEEIVVDDEQ